MTQLPASAQQFWTKKRTLAAQFLAEDVLTDEQIAKELGRSRAWLAELKHHPLMQARIASIVEETRQAVLRSGIADKVYRLKDLQRIRDLCIALIEKRGGLEAKDVKIAGNGDTVTVTYTDKAIADVLMKALDDAAKEVGDRSSDDKGANAALVVNFFGIEPSRLG